MRLMKAAKKMQDRIEWFFMNGGFGIAFLLLSLLAAIVIVAAIASL